MVVERLDRGLDLVERNAAVGGVLQRLRLDRAEHGGAAAFVLVGVRQLADDVFVAALAVRHQRRQVALRAGREKQRGFHAGACRHHRLQMVDGGIVAPDVVAQFGGNHRRLHRGARARHGIAAQIDHGNSLESFRRDRRLAGNQVKLKADVL